MVKIKQKKTMNLPQLIEWAWDNGIKNERFIHSDSNPPEYVWINENSNVELDEDMCISKTDTFTVEVEETVTEDTKFKYLVEISTKGSSIMWEHSYINQRIGGQSKEFHAYIDGEFKLIWRDGKLVE
ncbi:hypothetical protein [Staphylococcus sp. GDB9P120P]|uniref:hypothetical protein n=1 Tax=Staphylococcus sp. GDB9P120P TaxID=2804084 RepID=UPI001AEBC252|nr:hypothetical protein [Staphylococcus sp. GDB9P120P]